MSQSPSIGYTGRVIDQQRQAPISGAKVSFNSDEIAVFTYTDIEGIYRLFINSTDTNNLQGELTVEAEGYRNYESSIDLSPEQTELGDIRLLGVDEEYSVSDSDSDSNSDSNSDSDSDSNSDSNSDSDSWLEWDVDNSNLFPIIVMATIALFTIVILILNSTPRRNPEYRPDDSPRYFQSLI